MNSKGNTLTKEVDLYSPNGRICYSDSQDHFSNAFLRLMKLSREDFALVLKEAEAVGGDDRLACVGKAIAQVRPIDRDRAPSDVHVDRGPLDLEGVLWHSGIEESPDFGMARSVDASIGWLVRLKGDRFVREVSPPEYEEEYFEGDKTSAGGYGDYAAQEQWRMEKAQRQLREIGESTGIKPGLALDVGCGYGYFREALGEAGFTHEGLEISTFARRVAKENYGHNTHAGILDDHWESWQNKFDLITVWDVIEHVAEPELFLSMTASCLKPRGVLAIRTPNMDCPEADYFGPYYHSLKREHLVIFTPKSITQCAENSDLEVIDITTYSHLLQGFVGSEQVSQWERELRGADMTAYLRKL